MEKMIIFLLLGLSLVLEICLQTWSRFQHQAISMHQTLHFPPEWVNFMGRDFDQEQVDSFQ